MYTGGTQGESAFELANVSHWLQDDISIRNPKSSPTDDRDERAIKEEEKEHHRFYNQLVIGKDRAW